MFSEERPAKEWSVYLWGFLLTGFLLMVATHMFSAGIAMTKNTGIFTLFTTVSVIVSYVIGLFRYH